MGDGGRHLAVLGGHGVVSEEEVDAREVGPPRRAAREDAVEGVQGELALDEGEALEALALVGDVAEGRCCTAPLAL